MVGMSAEAGTPGRGRAWRTGGVLGILLVLLAAVALASTGATPVGTGGDRGPSDRVLDTFFSLVFVFMAAGSVGLVLLILLPTRELAEARAQARQRRGMLAAALTFGLVFLALALLLRYGVYRGGTTGEEGGLAPPSSLDGTRGQPLEEEPYEPDFAPWPVAVVLTLVALAAAAAYASRRARRRHLGAESSTVGLELAEVLDETIDDINAEVDARRAVIAAYARMERTLAAHGLPRRPPEAPEEYLDRALRELSIGARAIAQLTALYEWARFSHHAVGADMKARAIAALVSVQEDLRAARVAAEPERGAAPPAARTA